MTLTPSQREELRRLHAAATPGEWLYRPNRHDDWGFIRSSDALVAIARDSSKSYEHDNEHRRQGTDPYEHNARIIVAAHNHLPALLAALDEAEAMMAIERKEHENDLATITNLRRQLAEMQPVVEAADELSAALDRCISTYQTAENADAEEVFAALVHRLKKIVAARDGATNKGKEKE